MTVVTLAVTITERDMLPLAPGDVEVVCADFRSVRGRDSEQCTVRCSTSNHQRTQPSGRPHEGKGRGYSHRDLPGEAIQASHCYRCGVCSPTSYVHERWICSEGEACTCQYCDTQLGTVRLGATSPCNRDWVNASWSVRRGRDR